MSAEIHILPNARIERHGRQEHRFASDEVLQTARELGIHHEKSERRGTANVLNVLVADIEQYREAFKGATAIINQAGQQLALAQLKGTALLIVAEKLAPVIDAEIEERKHSGNVRDWAALQALSDELHAAIRLSTP